jgi:hypothetical protein
MARLNTNFKNVTDFVKRIDSKRNTKINIGFEWETPVDTDYVHDFYDGAYSNYSGPYSYKHLKDMGYNSHFECGGLEVCSPVFPTIATARQHAKNIIKVANCNKYMTPDYIDPDESPGIHVHGSVTGFDCYTTQKLADVIVLIMNDEEEEGWLWEFSGRENISEYCYQARVIRWRHLGTLTNPRGYIDNEMVRFNRPTPYSYTSEIRLWAGLSNRLIPAIEFTHAITRFAMPVVSKLKVKDVYRSADIPTLSQFKEWVMKQNGYNVLKGEL